MLYGRSSHKKLIPLLNTVISNDYLDNEIIKLAKRIVDFRKPSLVLMADLNFNNKDCSRILNRLKFDAKINHRSLYLILNSTPSKSILKVACQSFNEEIMIKSLMAVLVWRCMATGKALYFDEQGVCYFEYGRYQIYSLNQEQKNSLEEVLKQITSCDDYGLKLPTISEEVLSGLAPAKTNKKINLQTEHDLLSRQIGVTINNNFSPTQNKSRQNIYATNSAVGLNGGTAYHDTTQLNQNRLSDENQYFKPHSEVNFSGELSMPDTIVPSYYEYALMSDYGYLDLEDNPEQKNRLCLELGEDWEIVDCPEGALDSGYVGAIFIHVRRKQIVIAHAGTLPSRIKTLLADAQGVVGKDSDPLLIDAIMRSQGRGQVTLKTLVEQSGYQLSFTGHSLGGFSAEISVYACHRGFGFHCPEARAVVFDSPGSLEVIQVWESNIPEQKKNLLHLNVISFLSSPNLVNTLNSHPGTIYRLIRDIPRATFQPYLLESHDRKKLFALFNPETGYPLEDSWAEMQDWPLADYEELLSLSNHPLSEFADLAATKSIQFIKGLGSSIRGYLQNSERKVSLLHLFGGSQLRNLWELLNTEENYHRFFDTSTGEGLRGALQTHYVTQPNTLSLRHQFPLVNLSPSELAFLETHEKNKENRLYKEYCSHTGIIISLIPYSINRQDKKLYLINTDDASTIVNLLNALQLLRQKNKSAFANWDQNYINYVQKAISTNQETCKSLEEKIDRIQRETPGKQSLIKEHQSRLIETENKIQALGDELSNIKNEQALAKEDNQYNIWGFGAAIATVPHARAKATHTNFTHDDAARIINLMPKAEKAFGSSERPAIIAGCSAVAVEEGAEAEINVGWKSAAKSTAKVLGLFPANAVQCQNIANNIFKVTISYARTTIVERKALQEVLNNERYGIGAFGYIEGSVKKQSNCVVQLDFEGKDEADDLVDILNATILSFQNTEHPDACLDKKASPKQ